MSTVVESAMPTRTDLATWDESLWWRDGAYELVEGVPTMTPGESFANRAAGTLLAGLLNAVREGWVAASDVEVTLFDVPPTVRKPDVVVARRTRTQPDGAVLPENRLLASEVLFVVEVVSPTSAERDLVTKRREYAQAGIPAYLVVDLRNVPGELTLYAERDDEGRFMDVDPAERVEIVIDGLTIPVTVADLLS